MPKSCTKRVNYSADEKQLLTEILSCHKNVLENKKTNATTNRNKEEAWAKIKDLFHSRSKVHISRNFFAPETME